VSGELKAIPAIITAALLLAAPGAHAQPSQKEFTPKVGLVGKDVIWAPTPQALVDKMLDLAQVTAVDSVIDLGSGDGRTVITAAKRGARAVGIEYNPDLVELSKRNAEQAGVAGKTTFVKADIFQSDFSSATVITMFLLPDLNRRLRPKLLALKPGTRIVSNLFDLGDWQADDTAKVISLKNIYTPFLREFSRFIPASLTEDLIDYCDFYCIAYLWIVPARVAGVWQLPQGELTLNQSFQIITGTLKSGERSIPLANGRLRGDQISFSAGDAEYSGRVNGSRLEGSVKAGGNTTAWSATLRANNPVSSQKSR
jgi:SAM-dependent methyltransferase